MDSATVPQPNGTAGGQAEPATATSAQANDSDAREGGASAEPAGKSADDSKPGVKPQMSALAEIKAELEALGAKLLFEKTLTLSDGNGQGRIVIPKAQAEAHLPSLDNPAGISMSCIDTRGGEHPLKFRFWTNSQSRMYLLEGTQEIQAVYKLGVGDVMLFAKNGKGELVVCGRPGTSADVHRKPPVRKVGAPIIDRSRDARRARVVDPALLRKRSRTDAERRASGAPANHSFVELAFEPIKDGVFRALPEGTKVEKMGVQQWRGGWLGVLTVGGEVYHAYFSSQDAAHDAMLAAAV